MPLESPQPLTLDRALALADEALERHRRTVALLDGTTLAAIGAAWIATLQSGGRILFCGNGGSAADAQHLATELAVRYANNGPALAGLALTTDTSALTAIANDFGVEQLFSRQVEALARPGDLLVAISTSGRSPNVLAALAQARALNVATMGWCGQDPGPMAELADFLYAVPSRETARIQECHLLAGHIACEAVEAVLRP